MKKRFHSLTLLILIASLLFSFSSCSKSAEKNYVGGSASNESSSDILSENLAGNSLSGDRKIIETISLSLETSAFDSLLDEIEARTDELGGYVETSSIRGRSNGSSKLRYGEMTLRIPAKESGGFVDEISKQSTVLSRSVSTEDVTLKYVDTQSRLNALNAEKEALEGLLKKAATVDDIISVRDKLTEVIYEIESLEATLRNYDNRVDYTTVHLRINEVAVESAAEDASLWAEIKADFQKNLSGVLSFFRDFFVFLLGSIPLLLPVLFYAAIIIALVCFLKRRNKKKNVAKNPPREEKTKE